MEAVTDASGKRKLLCEFCSPEGITQQLCEVFKGQVKKEEAGSRATFNINKFVKPKNQPMETSIDTYFVLQDHCFPCQWPEGKPPSQQVTVMKTHYLINDPMPKITGSMDWNTEKYDRTTSALAKYAQDEKSMQVLVTEVTGTWKQIEQFVEYLKKVPFVLYASLASLLFNAACAAFIWMARGDIAKIWAFLKGMGG